MKTVIGLILVVGLIGCKSDVDGSRQAETASARTCHPKDFPVCVACCDARFPPGKKRGQCVSQAAHGEGDCVNQADCTCLVFPPPPDLSVPPPPPDMTMTVPDLTTLGD